MVIGESIPLIWKVTSSEKRTTLTSWTKSRPNFDHSTSFSANWSRSNKSRLAHFQSHYLPADWQKRVRSLGRLRELEVFLVDPYDIFVGKLFGVRLKDRADLNVLMSTLDRAKIRRRLVESSSGLRSDADLLEAARQNWFIFFGEELPA